MVWPIRSFNPKAGNVPLEGTPTVIEASDAPALQVAQTLAQAWQGDVAEASGTQRAAAHLAAVMADNYANHMLAEAQEGPGPNKTCPKRFCATSCLGLTQGGLNGDARERQTGPAKRGDDATLERHRALLPEDMRGCVRRPRRTHRQATPFMNYKTKLKAIKLFAFDYDGVFTNGTVYLMPDGSMARTASARDGFAVQWAVKQGLELAVITGGKEEPVRWRMEGLGVKEVHLGRLRQVGSSARTGRTKGPLAGGNRLHGRRPQRPESPASSGAQCMPL